MSGSNDLFELLLEKLYRFGPSAVLFAISIGHLASYLDSGSTGEYWGNSDFRGTIIFAVLGSIALGFSNILQSIIQPLAERFRQPVTNFLGARIENTALRLTSRFQAKYYDYLADEYRRYRTQGVGVAPANNLLGLEKMYVELEVAPRPYDRISPALIQTAEDSDKFKIWDFLATSTDERAYGRIALIAPPGAGKTVLLEHIVLTYAKNLRRYRNRKTPRLIPVLLSLRHIRGSISRDFPTLAALIEQQPDIQRWNPPPGWFTQRLERGQVLVMFDGLDEVPEEGQRQQVSRWINEQIRSYRRSRFIVTSRPLSYETAPIGEINTYLTLKPFGFKQIEAFARNWYLQDAVAHNLRRRAKLDRSDRRRAERKKADVMRRIRKDAALTQLALNPLLLAMILTIDHYGEKELPLHRVELYREIYDVLLEKRQQERSIFNPELAQQTRQVLQQLALTLMQQGAAALTPSDPEGQLPPLLQAVLSDPDALQGFLQQTDSAGGLLVCSSDGDLSFAHESFQYYLAAREIQNTTPPEAQTCPPILEQHLNDAWWTETILLYGAMISEGSEIVQRAIDRGDRVSLALAHAMVQDNVPVSADVRQQLQQQLDEGLSSPDAAVADLAARVKLTSRLRNLRPLDVSTDIDPDYLSIAEYQLFLSAMEETDAAHHPDHWPDHWERPQSAPQDAQDLITGLRPDDARAYGDWLSETHPAESAATRFRYRLPTPAEMDTLPPGSTTQPVGAWCAQGNYVSLRGLSGGWQKQWARKLLGTVESYIEGDREVAQQMVSALNQPLPETVGIDEDAFRLPLNTHLRQAAGKVSDLGLNQALQFAGSSIFEGDPQLDFLRRAVQIIRNQLPPTRTLLDRTRPYDERGFPIVRAHLIVVAILWSQLAIAYREYYMHQEQRRFPPAYLSRWLTLSQRQRYRTCRAQRDRVLELYSFFVLLDARRQGDMPAWEGIRIVRDKLSP